MKVKDTLKLSIKLNPQLASIYAEFYYHYPRIGVKPSYKQAK